MVEVLIEKGDLNKNKYLIVTLGKEDKRNGNALNKNTWMTRNHRLLLEGEEHAKGVLSLLIEDEYEA